MSTSAVHQRVRRLEKRGVIKGYTARVDHAAIGVAMTAFISITPLDPTAPDDIPDHLRDIPAIEECHSVAGDMNYILKVRVATPLELEELLARIRAAANVSTRRRSSSPLPGSSPAAALWKSPRRFAFSARSSS